MLFDGAQTAQLQAYIDDLQDKELYKWWAQFAESSGQLELALEYYARAADVLAQVRALCLPHPNHRHHHHHHHHHRRRRRRRRHHHHHSY